MSSASWPIPTTAAEIDNLIAKYVTHGALHRAVLLRGVRDGLMNIIEPGRKSTIPSDALTNSTRPLCVLIGDDDYQTTGPDGWLVMPQLLRWARSGVIHAAGADEASYEAAVIQTMMSGRFLLVETAPDHARRWGAALEGGRVPFIGIVPPECAPQAARNMKEAR